MLGRFWVIIDLGVGVGKDMGVGVGKVLGNNRCRCWEGFG